MKDYTTTATTAPTAATSKTTDLPNNNNDNNHELTRSGSLHSHSSILLLPIVSAYSINVTTEDDNELKDLAQLPPTSVVATATAATTTTKRPLLSLQDGERVDL